MKLIIGVFVALIMIGCGSVSVKEVATIDANTKDINITTSDIGTKKVLVNIKGSISLEATSINPKYPLDFAKITKIKLISTNDKNDKKEEKEIIKNKIIQYKSNKLNYNIDEIFEIERASTDAYKLNLKAEIYINDEKLQNGQYIINTFKTIDVDEITKTDSTLKTVFTTNIVSDEKIHLKQTIDIDVERKNAGSVRLTKRIIEIKNSVNNESPYVDDKNLSMGFVFTDNKADYIERSSLVIDRVTNKAYKLYITTYLYFDLDGITLIKSQYEELSVDEYIVKAPKIEKVITTNIREESNIINIQQKLDLNVERFNDENITLIETKLEVKNNINNKKIDLNTTFNKKLEFKDNKSFFLENYSYKINRIDYNEEYKLFIKTFLVFDINGKREVKEKYEEISIDALEDATINTLITTINNSNTEEKITLNQTYEVSINGSKSLIKKAKIEKIEITITSDQNNEIYKEFTFDKNIIIELENKNGYLKFNKTLDMKKLFTNQHTLYIKTKVTYDIDGKKIVKEKYEEIIVPKDAFSAIVEITTSKEDINDKVELNQKSTIKVDSKSPVTITKREIYITSTKGKSEEIPNDINNEKIILDNNIGELTLNKHISLPRYSDEKYTLYIRTKIYIKTDKKEIIKEKTEEVVIDKIQKSEIDIVPSVTSTVLNNILNQKLNISVSTSDDITSIELLESKIEVSNNINDINESFIINPHTLLTGENYQDNYNHEIKRITNKEYKIFIKTTLSFKSDSDFSKTKYEEIVIPAIAEPTIKMDIETTKTEITDKSIILNQSQKVETDADLVSKTIKIKSSYSEEPLFEKLYSDISKLDNTVITALRPTNKELKLFVFTDLIFTDNGVSIKKTKYETITLPAIDIGYKLTNISNIDISENENNINIRNNIQFKVESQIKKEFKISSIKTSFQDDLGLNYQEEDLSDQIDTTKVYSTENGSLTLNRMLSVNRNKLSDKAHKLIAETIITIDIDGKEEQLITTKESSITAIKQIKVEGSFDNKADTVKNVGDKINFKEIGVFKVNVLNNDILNEITINKVIIKSLVNNKEEVLSEMSYGKEVLKKNSSFTFDYIIENELDRLKEEKYSIYTKTYIEYTVDNKVYTEESDYTENLVLNKTDEQYNIFIDGSKVDEIPQLKIGEDTINIQLLDKNGFTVAGKKIDFKIIYNGSLYGFELNYLTDNKTDENGFLSLKSNISESANKSIKVRFIIDGKNIKEIIFKI
jgi:hypothetical protein